MCHLCRLFDQIYLSQLVDGVVVVVKVQTWANKRMKSSWSEWLVSVQVNWFVLFVLSLTTKTKVKCVPFFSVVRIVRRCFDYSWQYYWIWNFYHTNWRVVPAPFSFNDAHCLGRVWSDLYTRFLFLFSFEPCAIFNFSCLLIKVIHLFRCFVFFRTCLPRA